MVSKDLTFRLFGEDSTASSTLRRLSENAERAASRMTKSMGISHATIGGLVGGVVGGVTSGITSMIGSAVSDIGSMLTDVGGMIASTVIDFNSTLENANIGFTTMLGSGRKAQGFLNDLQDFAKSTPFEFGNLVSNAQQMMGMGIAAKDVIPTLTALGDSVASMGGSAQQVDQVTLAFSQMAAKGTLDMGNMNQLLQGGLPTALKVLASSYGVTTGKMIAMISAGDVQASRALPALVKGIEKGTKSTAALGGMMSKQSSTFTGALSNIQDGLTQTVSKAFKPFFDTATHGMGRFATALSGKPAQKFTRDVTATLRPFAKEIDKWFKGIDLNKIFKGAGKALKDTFKGIDPKDFGKGLKDLGDALGNIVKQTPKVIKAIKDMGPAFTETLKQVGDIIGGISDFIDWLDKLDKGFTSFHNVNKSFKKDGEDIQGIIDAVGSFIGDRAKSIQLSFAQIASFFADRVKSIQLSGQQIIDFFAGIPAAMTTIGTNMVNGLIGGLQNAWGGLMGTLHDLAMMLPEPVRKALNIHSPSRVFHEIGRNVGQGLHNGLLGTKDQIQAASNKLADAVVSMFEQKKGGISKSTETRALDVIHSGTKRLEELAKKRAIVATKLKAAQDTLKQALSDRKDYAAGVKSSTVAAGDVTTLGSAGDMVQRLHDLVAHTKTFRSIMGQLAKKGIDRVTYDELAQAGVAGGGLEAAQSLLANPLDFKQVVDLQKQLNAAAGGLGSDTSVHQFRRTLATDRGRVSDLQHLDTAYARQQRTAARSLVRNAERDVHVTVNLSGHVYGSKTELAKAVTDAIRAATRSGAISKNALKV